MNINSTVFYIFFPDEHH